jgi:DNA-binding transcriptional ArsR family regulator
LAQVHERDDSNSCDGPQTVQRSQKPWHTFAKVPQVSFIEMEEARRRPIRVAVSPLFSLFMATRDALGAERSGTPDPWCSAIRTHLTRRDHEVFAPLTTSEVVWVPDAILPYPEAPGQRLKDGLERIVAAEAELVRDIDSCVRAGRAGDWREPMRDPGRWVRSLVLALARAWHGFAPIWQQAQDAVALEIERVGVASARDSQLELLDSLLPIGRVQNHRWEIDNLLDEDVRHRVPDDGLVVIPLVAGRRASIVDCRYATMLHVAYPALRLRSRAAAGSASPASLEALLGIPRARILRELEQPSSNLRLAEVLQTVPSAATHHVTALQAAGLVSRDRAGRHVIVRRTDRGEALLALYGLASG